MGRSLTHIKLKKGAQPKHGDAYTGSVTAEYNAWCNMKGRCLNPNHEAYENYGGRGIEICERWAFCFENFLADMGRRPSIYHSLDRFPNKNGNYEPSNCRWATTEQQNRNYRRNRWIKHTGLNMIISDWAKYLNMNLSYMYILLKKMSFSKIYNKYKHRINGV